jgi:hypothetical protein
MRNSSETDCELLLRPEAEVVLGRAVRRCWPTARFMRFLQPEAADPNRRTYRGAPRRGRRRAALRSWLPNLVPTHGRGPRRPRRRSTWLLLSPKSERPRAPIRCLGSPGLRRQTLDLARPLAGPGFGELRLGCIQYASPIPALVAGSHQKNLSASGVRLPFPLAIRELKPWRAGSRTARRHRQRATVAKRGSRPPVSRRLTTDRWRGGDRAKDEEGEEEGRDRLCRIR